MCGGCGSIVPNQCERCGGEIVAKLKLDGTPRKRRFCDQCNGIVRKKKACAKCGAPTSHIYCSKACRSTASNERARKTGKSKSEILAESARKCAATCRYCGKSFVAKDARQNTFCSRECAFKLRTNSKELQFCRVYYPACHVCGTIFMARIANKQTCSDECRKRDIASKARSVAAAKKDIEPRPCKECGKAFVPEYGNRRKVFCSITCMTRQVSRTAKAKRRARKISGQADNVNPIAVFERDGWSCQICGCDTPKELRGTNHDDAPELDHVVPLSRGGAHTWDNTQCACRLCNLLKGAKMMHEFMQWNQGHGGASKGGNLSLSRPLAPSRGQ